MQKKLLVVVAHPDDESFGFGGTLAKCARSGVEIHVLCATKGEHGQGQGNLGIIRAKELRHASSVLGVQSVEFLGYTDGSLCNDLYHEIAQKVEGKIKSFSPQVVLTFDRLGVSGHLDHIFMSLVTTYVCKKYQHHLKLFYLVEQEKFARLFGRFYYIFFPPGCVKEEADVVVDIASVWDQKIQAMKAHKTQAADVRRILLAKRFFPKEEYFLEAFKKNKKVRGMTNLFGD